MNLAFTPTRRGSWCLARHTAARHRTLRVGAAAADFFPEAGLSHLFLVAGLSRAAAAAAGLPPPFPEAGPSWHPGAGASSHPEVETSHILEAFPSFDPEAGPSVPPEAGASHTPEPGRSSHPEARGPDARGARSSTAGSPPAVQALGFSISGRCMEINLCARDPKT